MKKLFFAGLLLVLLLSSCESPMDAEFIELDGITGCEIIRQLLKEGGSCSPGYQNGNIRSNSVSLTWNVTTAENFLSYRILRDVELKKVFTDINAAAWTDTLVAENTEYLYKIITFARNGMSAIDTIMIKTPQWQSPSDLMANGLSATDVMLTWEDNTDSEENFRIYLYEEDGISLIDSFCTAADENEFRLTELDPIQSYFFNVKAVSQYEDDTPLSNLLEFDMNSFYMNPPQQLALSQNMNNSLDLAWVDDATLETGFSIERKINSGSYSEIAQTEMNIEYFCDMDTLAWTVGDTVAYRLRAFNDYQGMQYSAYSTEVWICIADMEIPEISIHLQVDNYYYEASWNLVNTDTGEAYYDDDQTFEYGYMSVERIFHLFCGNYKVVCYDSYGDGGISGTVMQGDEVLTEWESYHYNDVGEFSFNVEY